MDENFFNETFKKRFWSYVDILDNVNDCWIWKKARITDGYGQSSYKHKGYRAHRIAWILTNGEIPEGCVIHHVCNNPPCCNPNHLKCGTQTENIQARHAQGRSKGGILSGENSPNSKLTNQIILYIRNSSESATVLAAKYGVAHQTISKIRLKQLWKHI